MTDPLARLNSLFPHLGWTVIRNRGADGAPRYGVLLLAPETPGVVLASAGWSDTLENALDALLAEHGAKLSVH